jgi:hypothetical protein
MKHFSWQRRRFTFCRIVAVVCVFLLLKAPVVANHRQSTEKSPQKTTTTSKAKFSPKYDGFAFANDTVREYRQGSDGRITAVSRAELVHLESSQKPDVSTPRMHANADAPRYQHSCFILCRAAIQFYRFAQFDPKAPRLSPEDYRPLLKHLFRIPVWFPDRAGKPHAIVIPGYRNVYEFSKSHARLIQETGGAWLPTYFRVGNWRMIGPFPRWGQHLASERLLAGLDCGELQAVYVARFPHLNHCLVIYDYLLEPGGNIQFLVYDPNYPRETAWLRYHARSRTFELQKRFYFNAGLVNVMRVYISPLH